tara:strand:+ start:145 stop:498 length:354 start_codon:yes stop_codon:yes gene_type:complete
VKERVGVSPIPGASEEPTVFVTYVFPSGETREEEYSIMEMENNKKIDQELLRLIQQPMVKEYISGDVSDKEFSCFLAGYRVNTDVDFDFDLLFREMRSVGVTSILEEMESDLREILA